MNKEFKKALSNTARQLNMREKEVFAEIIKLSVFSIFAHFDKPMNAQYDLIHADISFIGFDFQMPAPKLLALAELQSLLHVQMKAAEPFSDVITEFYNSEFISQKNKSGQFMTPMSLADKLLPFLFEDTFDGESSFCEPTCGTGTLALSTLKAIYNKHGKHGLVDKTLVLNDIDPTVLRIALYQVMFHSFHHNAPLKCIDIKCSDLINEYLSKDAQTVLVCKIKEPMERELALMKALAFHFSNDSNGLSIEI
ncbi:N-6 DNA methylase [Brucella gallinifaecis]|uniref:N-6 DNA methylase n=1 Tax=Brucella gallinifaecis TaxID=215590 RepID=UPI0023623220|nr:N-6 DNA methylase [Brucella gallinifaecis]